MRREVISLLFLIVLTGVLCTLAARAQAHKPAAKKTTAKKPTPEKAANKPASKPAAKKTNKTADAATHKTASKPTGAQAEFDELVKLPAAERVTRLQAFLDANPPAALRARAVEHLIGAHAALGDERLQAGDAEAGVAEFKQALALAPPDMSDKLFVEVVSQFPANLFLRGQQAAAREAAQLIEAKVKDNPQRLLALAAFYLNVEQPDEAARLAETARTLAPDLAAAHQALGAAYRLALRLDEATAEYKRALELDPKSMVSRRNLAELLRAGGKPEEALALYREQLAADPKDRLAQAGVVLSLLDAGKREDAERELAAALQDEPRNLTLLVGAGYWYAAHGDAARALELASRAVDIEPRYTWAQVALARALVADRRAADAERALRFARLHGRFPTLDYELASALAAAGLYEEAAEELAHTFTLKDGQLETQLAGRTPARADNFIELLAPERRASIFQFAPADTDANARMLKGLLAFQLALDAPGGPDEAALAAAAREFAAGDDTLRAFRQLYAADRLARRGVALTTAVELAEAAKSGVEAAADTPVASVAVAADELQLIRARAISAGGTPDFPVISRETLSRIMRGRTEELIGWALFNQGKAGEAVTALKRAVSVLPPASLYWRNTQWRLGAALAANGQPREALAAYVKGYDRLAPDPARRAIIEALYAKVNGSTKGLDALIGPPALVSSTNADATTPTPAANAAPAQANESPTPAPTETPKPSETSKASETPAPTPTPETKPVEDAPPAPTPPPAAPTPTPTPAETPAEPTPTPVESKPTPEPAASPSPTAEPKATPTPTPEPTATPSPTPEPVATPSPTPVATPSPTPVAAPSPVDPQATPVETKPAETKPADAKPAETAPAAPAVDEKPPAEQSKAEVKPAAGRGGRAQRAADCTLTLSVDALSLTTGSAGTLTATLAGQPRGADVNATTNDWADIIILREPQDAPSDTARYTITSISKKTGTFLVTFKSPCGTKEVAVTVK